MDSDLAALKEYVTATDGEQFSRLPEGVVSINISHSNISARMIELKLDLHQTVCARMVLVMKGASPNIRYNPKANPWPRYTISLMSSCFRGQLALPA